MLLPPVTGRYPEGKGFMGQPVLSQEGGFYVLGLEVRTSAALEADLATARIPGLWAQVYHDPRLEGLPRRLAKGKLFGVYHAYQGDENGAYSLLAGYQVPDLREVPAGLKGLAVPGGRYLVFTAEGELPGALRQTWEAIQGYFARPDAPRRAFSYDYEIYEDLTRVSVYIALR